MSVRALDLFAGPGGWDEGAASLGVRPLGIERDATTCATREAAGHDTVRGDVAELDPLDFAPCELLIASPPCPTFSAAGARAGHAVVELLVACATALASGRDGRPEARHFAYTTLEEIALRREHDRARNSNSVPNVVQARARAQSEAHMSVLVVEPLRWALDLRPRLIAWEQVPPVLPLWAAFAFLLQREGYHTWHGLLSAERYGVPQTRERAFMLASLDGPVLPPEPTHQHYEPGVHACEQLTICGVLQPWVSMADALGWGMTARPSTTVVAQGKTGGPKPLAGGAGSQAVLDRERDEGRWQMGFPRRADTPSNRAGGGVVVIDGEDYRARDFRGADEPSFAVTEKTRSWTVVDERDPTWATTRPATTVACDPRVPAPGHKREANRPDAPGRMEGAIRVSLADAAVLQGFRRDYPFHGKRTRQFEQVGNAVPPPLARAVLSAVLRAGATTERMVA